MELLLLSGGEAAAKRPRLASSSDAAGEDRLSALPDDALVLILSRLNSTAAAARTSVLSRRWRRVWTLLPDLNFPFSPMPDRFDAALASHGADLRLLAVGTLDAAPQSVAAWLPVAARRLSGFMVFSNRNLARGSDAEDREEAEPAQGGAFELPCFDRAAGVSLDLGFLGLAVPPAAGVFARLTELALNHVRFHGPCELGDVVSSVRCPCLQNLTIRDTRGLENFTIHSKSLLLMELKMLRGLQQLTVLAPALLDLAVISCFSNNQNPVATISAPELKLLEWRDPYHRSSVHLGKLGQLQMLGTNIFFVYGPDDITYNLDCLRLLQRFKVVEKLFLTLLYARNIGTYQYLMEDMTMLPHIKYLFLTIIVHGHAFGASTFHVLRMCTDIRMLVLLLRASTNPELETVCTSVCVCHQTTNWKIEELSLNHLEEIEIGEFRGSEHEVDFVKQLFGWARVLKKMKVSFDYGVTESMVQEVYEMFRSFSRSEICMEFYLYEDFVKVLYTPED